MSNLNPLALYGLLGLIGLIVALLFRNRSEASKSAALDRRELRETLALFRSELRDGEKENRAELKAGFEKLDHTLDRKLKELSQENSKKLDEMRATVDEKLEKTLNERLTQSFKRVSDNLEAVNRGLGEMKGLANGVGDLKKVLANVKTRGIFGEIQLGNILGQILSPAQYEKNASPKAGSRDQVEFAIKLPGKGTEGSPVLLPIDSKFPLEPYEKLLTAYDSGQVELIKNAGKELESTIKKCAKDIRDKYLDPPNTTDFGILFLPIEGLYAEVVREPALLDTLQRDFRIVVAGPSTLVALLNSLQMGFQTLAFEKRSQEIREILGAVKKEFGTFGKTLGEVQKKLHGASDELEHLVGTRTRKIQGTLRSVEELPETEATALLNAAPSDLSGEG